MPCHVLCVMCLGMISDDKQAVSEAFGEYAASWRGRQTVTSPLKSDEICTSHETAQSTPDDFRAQFPTFFISDFLTE